MPRLVKLAPGSAFADEEPPAEDALATLPGAADARSDWLDANRLAYRRRSAVDYARAELAQLQRDGVPIPVLRAAAGLVDARERLAEDAAARAVVALQRFDNIVNPARRRC